VNLVHPREVAARVQHRGRTQRIHLVQSGAPVFARQVAAGRNVAELIVLRLEL
jgi:hypothetical protein